MPNHEKRFLKLGSNKSTDLSNNSYKKKHL